MARIIAIIVILSMLGGAAWFIYKAGQDSIIADQAGTIAKAVKKARAEEQAKQKGANDAVQKQFENQININAQLNADLDKLRQRASRRHMPKASKTTCKGASGADLSSEDAGFLTREAARADSLRIALQACYAVVP